MTLEPYTSKYYPIDTRRISKMGTIQPCRLCTRLKRPFRHESEVSLVEHLMHSMHTERSCHLGDAIRCHQARTQILSPNLKSLDTHRPLGVHTQVKVACLVAPQTNRVQKTHLDMQPYDPHPPIATPTCAQALLNEHKA